MPPWLVTGVETVAILVPCRTSLDILKVCNLALKVNGTPLAAITFVPRSPSFITCASICGAWTWVNGAR